MPVGWTKDETIIVIAKLLQCPDPLSPGKPVLLFAKNEKILHLK